MVCNISFWDTIFCTKSFFGTVKFTIPSFICYLDSLSLIVKLVWTFKNICQDFQWNLYISMFHISKVFPYIHSFKLAQYTIYSCSKQQTFVMSLSEFVRVVKIFDFAFISPLFTIPICSPISIALILHTVQLTHPYIHNQSQTYLRNFSFDTFI